MRSSSYFYVLLALVALLLECVVGAEKERVLLLTTGTESSPEIKQLLKLIPKRATVTTRTYDKRVKLIEDEELVFESVIIAGDLSNLKDPKDHLHAYNLVDFVNRGGNLVLFVNDQISDHWREVALEFGVQFEPADTHVYDHFGALGDDPRVLALDAKKHLTPASRIAKASAEPIVFKGIGHSRALRKTAIGARKLAGYNPLVASVLNAPVTAYSATAKGNAISRSSAPFPWSYSQLSLVSVAQARNNARVAFIGSSDIYAAEYLTEKNYGNAPFLRQLLEWTLGLSGRVRIDSVYHGHVERNSDDLEAYRKNPVVNGSSDVFISPNKYRIKDEIEYFIKISESQVDGSWVPLDVNDLQLDITMLHPFYRLTLKQVSPGLYSTGRIMLPDVYGVFSFKIQYQRMGNEQSAGLDYINFKQKVVILPFRHDEYERFIPAAFPYYSNVFSMMVAYLLLSLVVMYGRADDNGAGSSKKKKAGSSVVEGTTTSSASGSKKVKAQ